MLASRIGLFHSEHCLKRIVVIEDEASVREAIVLALEQENYEVLTAVDGETGFNLIFPPQLQNPVMDAVDLLILDRVLPGIDGLGLCELLRSKGSCLPILMISASGTEADRVAGLEHGADDYLTKPFGLRELVARCRALLRRPPSQFVSKSSILQVREIILNLETSTVLVRGQEVKLAPKELQMLYFLMSYPYRVWSRAHLIKQIWGQNYIGDPKTIDVHIRWLREKLELDPSNPEYITTVRGFGYRFS